MVWEPESVELEAWLGSQTEPVLISSVLARAEVVRAVARTDPDAVHLAVDLLAAVAVVELDVSLADTAAQLDPTDLRSLDALHLAAALRVPAVAFYGPNDPKLYGPVGEQNTIIYKNLECSPCITNFNDKTTNCPHGNCIQTITVEETYLAIQRNPIKRKGPHDAGTSPR